MTDTASVAAAMADAALDGEGQMTARVGAPAVDFALEDTRGAVHRLARYRGSWLLMVFHRHLG